ncbi:ABC transporter ATP-binding protein [Methylococcus sp. Mc7]|uniref:ABC transporter ATP-binding protein n=1 Tax=Methylococcus sp. Mc7 TaxID=2860258 RepID=UPI001C52D33B|nr:ABC transporter ATP-binding protein [Methylococcus sp. Mc7]QXP82900.1 ABC transporter ATP-binding protein/permease [Methylococcus sp. Mc7]
MFDRYRLHRLWQLCRSVQLVWQSSRKSTLIHGGLMLVLGLLPVAGLYLVKLIIDTVTAPGAPEWESIGGLLVAALSIAVLTDWLRALDAHVSEIQSQQVTDYVQDLLHKQAIRLDLGYYENPEFQDNLHRAQTEAAYRPALIVDQLIRLLQNAVSLGAVALLLLAFHWELTLGLFLFMLPILFVRLRHARLQHRHWQNWTARQRQTHYLSQLLNFQDHAKEVRLFGLGNHLHQRFMDLRKSIRQDRLALSRDRTKGEALTQGCASLGVYGALAFLAYETMARAISVGDMVVYYQALQRGQTLLRDLFASAAGLYENALFLSNFYDFLLLEPRVKEPEAPCVIPHPLRGEIRFECVSFDYPHGTRPVLKAVDFTIHAGEKVALVGKNGAGKTTLIKLLCRLHDPTEGRITVDGIDLRNFSSDEWRKQIGVVFQDFGRYQFTARENIGFGDLSALNVPGRIERAAGLSGADGAIASLPHGYDTLLGTLFAGGEELSIGQWQQIAIARAALRSAAIIILDEPTSALDSEAEARVLERFRQLAEGRTAILISHRLSTVRLADRIFVINDGQISEAGTHAELLRLNGAYASMFHAQARHYKSSRTS